MRTARRFRLVLTTVDTEQTARRISRALVSSKLAACVSAVPGVRSVYRWKGRIEEARERLLIIKTTATNLPGVERTLRELHPYEVPEILSVRVDRGSESYLAWLSGETKKERE